jgi:hypothetical protein
LLFGTDAPGALTEESGDFYGDWSLATPVVGISEATAEAWIADALTDSQGWGRAGITFRQQSYGSEASRVTFQVVNTIPDVPEGWDGQGINFEDGTGLVYLEASSVGSPWLVNHEAAHAFFAAEHTSGGIMPHNASDATEWPSDGDIASLRDWLGLPPEEGGEAPSAPGDYWFPGDLETYITRQSIPEGTQARITATVISGANVTLRAVYSENLSEMLSGTHERFTRGIGVSSERFRASEWRTAPAGDLHIGILAQAEDVADLQDLVIGLAEVQLRSTP